MKKLFFTCFLIGFTFCSVLAVNQYENTDFGYVRFDEVNSLPRAIFNINDSRYSGSPTEIAEAYIADNSYILFKNSKPELVLYKEITDSPAGAKITFQQYEKGVPVVGAFTTVSIDKTGTVTMLVNEYIPDIEINTTPVISASNASIIAEEIYKNDILKVSTEKLVVINENNVSLLTWRFYMRFEEEGSHIIYIDANNGQIIRNDSAEIGSGYVFDPDPSTQLGYYVDDYGDTDDPVFANCYTDVDLPNIDPSVNGLYKLRGAYAYSDNIIVPNDPITYENTNDFYYNRSQNGFEEANVYYAVDKEVSKSRSLGFIPLWEVDPALQISNSQETLAFDARGIMIQNAFFNCEEKYMAFGVPADNVDLAEDLSIIYHEFGHALHDAMVPGGFASSGHIEDWDFLRFAEGFGDYYAISRRREAEEREGSGYFMPNSVSNFACPDLRVSVLPPDIANYSDSWWDDEYMHFYPKGAAFCSTLMDLEYNVGTDPTQGRRLDQEVVTTLVLATFQSVGVTLSIDDFLYAMIENDFSIYGGVHSSTIFDVFSTRLPDPCYLLSQDITSTNYLNGYVIVNSDISVIDASLSIGSHTKVLLNGTLNIEQESTFSLGSSSTVNFFDRDEIFVDESSLVIFGENTKIIGKYSTVFKDPPFVPEEIPGNKIKIYGDIYIEGSVTFTTDSPNLVYPPDSDFSWDGLELYNNSNDVVVFNDVSFNNCKLYSERRSIKIYDSAFENSSISTSLADVTIEDTYIDGYISSKGPIFTFSGDPGVVFNVLNCNIQGYHSGISLNGNHTYTISYSGISNNEADGISISESRKPGSSINNCYINNNNGAGVRFYSSVGDLNSNNISNNVRGVAIIRNSTVEMKKIGDIDQSISNNILENISFLDDCTVSLATNKNKIINPGTYNMICPNLSTTRNFNYNMWDTNGYPNANLFYPPIIDPAQNEIGYILTEIWEGDNVDHSAGLVKSIFDQGVNALKTENYDIAELKFKEIIEEYPESQYLYGSAKNLLQLEDDYDDLKDYFATIDNTSNPEQISKYINYLEYNCDLLSGDLVTAMDYLENIIESPSSEIDSLMAYIDLMNLDLLTGNQDSLRKATSFFIDNSTVYSIDHFEHKRNNLIDNMLNLDVDDNMQDEYLASIVEAKFSGNYPNPFNPETAISYTLPKQGNVQISIYNIKGQKVKTLVKNNSDAGRYTIVWNGKDTNEREVASGVYLYRLEFNGKNVDVKKCILMK